MKPATVSLALEPLARFFSVLENGPILLKEVGVAYSMDLRRRVIALLERGESAAGVARLLEIHERTVRELRDRHAAGRLAPDKPGPRGPVKLTPQDLDTLRHAVRRRPDATLRELAALLSVAVAESTVHRALARLGLSFKKRR